MSDGVKNELSAFPGYNEFADCAQWKGETIIELHKTNTTEARNLAFIYNDFIFQSHDDTNQNFVLSPLTLTVHT